MDEKIITIALLPYPKAEILRSLLEAKGISCSLENVNQIQGAVATGVKVRINAKDIKKAFPILEKTLGKVEKEPHLVENVILVPVDFTDHSLKAATIAAEIAQKLNSGLLFYHVIPHPDYFSIPYSDVIPYDIGVYEHLKEREESVQEEFDKFLETLSFKVGKEMWSSLKVEQIAKMGYAEDDILNYTDIHPPRLIVMGIKGPSKGMDRIMGSTTAGIIYKARVPVLVVPEEAPAMNLSSVKKVVYATDFDEKDLTSLDKLLGLLKPFSSEVTCLHVGKSDEHDLDQVKLKSLKKALKKEFKDFSLTYKIIEGDDVLNELEKYIIDNEIDVLSLTTHKRNMITRFFNPSIAKKMVFHLKTPLFVFHA